MAKCGDPRTLAILRNVAAMVEDEEHGTIVDLEDGRYLTLIVAADEPQGAA